MSNGQRTCTLVRFLIEHSIGMLKQRYKCTHYIKPHFLSVFGLLLRFISAIHVKYEIGKVVPGEHKKNQLLLLNSFSTTFPNQHPISREVFIAKTKQAIKKTTGWKRCKTSEELLQLIDKEKFIFEAEDLFLKTTKFYVKKAQQYLWLGRNDIRVFVNPENHNEVVVDKIPKAMSKGTPSTVYLLWNNQW